MMDSKKGERLVVLAGGTDVVPQLRSRKLAADCFLDLMALGLGEIREVDGGVIVGATCTMTQVAASPVIQKHFPALAKGAASVGAVQTRGLATVGGNSVNAAPGADTFPALLVYDAQHIVASASGERRVPAAEFITGLGKTQLKEGELLTGIFLPLPKADFKSDFIKFGRRRALALAVVNVGLGAEVSGGVIKNARVAIGACAPTPVRAVTAEQYLEGKTFEQICFDELTKLVQGSINPRKESIRASGEYRMGLAPALVTKLVRAVMGKE